MTKYTVETKAIGGWTRHSEHDSYRSAVDQSDMVAGRVLVEPFGVTDKSAWKHASIHQGFNGDFAAWQEMDDDERSAYEAGEQGANNED